MEPDPDSVFSRAERTLLSVWCYITEAVSRLLRPQPAETAGNDPNSSQESRVDGEPSGSGQTGADAGGDEAREDPSLTTVSLLQSSSAVVAWEHCSTDVTVKPKEDHENEENIREELFSLTGNDNAGQLVTEGAKSRQDEQEKTEIETCDTCEDSKTPENNKGDATDGSGHMQLKEGVSDGKDSSVEEEEHVSAVRLDECREAVEALTETQEDDLEENEEGLEEEGKQKECASTDEEESKVEIEEQRENKASTMMSADANICEDPSQLSSENENSEEGTQQVETQHLVCRELSGVAEEESVQVAAIDEEEPTESATQEEPEQKESSRADEDDQQEENILNQSVTSSEMHHGRGEERFGLTGNNRAEQLITEPTTVPQLVLEKGEIQNVHTCAGGEVVENKEDEATVESENTQNEAICDEVEVRGEEAASGEEPVSTVRLDEFPEVDEAKEELEEESSEIQEVDGEDYEEESEVKQLTVIEEEDSNGETGEQGEGEAAAEMLEDNNIGEDENSEEGTQQAETQHLVCRELSGVAEDESVQVAAIDEEEPTESATQEEPEQKESSRADEDDQQEENILNQSVTMDEMDHGRGEERFGLTGNNRAEQLITEPTTVPQLGLEKGEIQNVHTCVGREGVENKDDEATVESENTQNEAICGEMEKKGEEAASGEEPVSTVRLDEFPEVDEAKEELEEESSEIQEEEIEEESEVKQLTVIEEEDSNGETGEQGEGDAAAEMLEDNNIGEDENSEEETQAETQHLVCRELSGVAEDESVQVAAIDEEEPTESATQEEPEQKESSREDEDDRQEENVLNQSVTSSEMDHGRGEEQFDLTGNNHCEASAVILRNNNVSEDTLPWISENENGSNEKVKDIENQLPVCKDFSEDKLTDENIQMTVFEEEDPNVPASYQTMDEESKKDKSRGPIKDEENVSSQSLTSNEEDVQNTEPDTTGFTSEEEDLLATMMQTDTEKDVTREEISADVDSEMAEEEGLSSEVTDKESCMERVCTTAPVAVKGEGESAQEINRRFNNIPPGLIEGQAALSHELDSEACEETPEAVPEHNNELESDENTTQRFLEGGNSEEVQTIHLPEEVEVFKSSDARGGECLPTGQDDSENGLDLVAKEQTAALRFVEDPEEPKSDDINLESQHSSEDEKAELLNISMKTEIQQSDEDFETYSADETDLQDDDQRVEFEMTGLSEEAAEDGCERRDVLAADEGVDFAGETPESLSGKEEKMTEMSLSPEIVRSFCLQDDRDNLKRSIELKPKLFDESGVELLQTGFDSEERGCTDEGEPDHDILNFTEITALQLAGTAADLITGQSELSQHLETNNQAPLRAPQMTETEITTDTGTADESKTATPEGFPVISAEETKEEPQPAEICSESPAGEHQDVIDEETLDLWIETAMSKDADRITEEDLSERALQKDLFDEELGKTSSEKKKEEVMEANSEEPESAPETGTSSTTPESGFLDQSFSETRLKHANVNDMLTAATNSEDSESALVEEMVETAQSFQREEGVSSEIRSWSDSGVLSPEARHPNQEWGTSQEKPEETKPEREAETDAACEDNEEADVTSQTIKADDEVLEATVSDEMRLPEPGQQTENVEPLSEEGTVSKASPSGGELQIESEKQQFSLDAPEHRWSEDLIKSFSSPRRTEVEGDRREVDGPMLDFAVQRSRIAVKNPRVRPPTDPRSLIHMPSVDPTPSPRVPGKVPAGVPLGGVGIGIKLPGLGGGFPVLKKTQRVLKDDNNQETQSQESGEKKEEEEKSDAGKKDEAPQRPKWMPPGQPGFGNPLMSELRTKLKKTPKE
ncbi:uncharacterized protein V3H82_000532 [Fundulus diaphanus]